MEGGGKPQWKGSGKKKKKNMNWKKQQYIENKYGEELSGFLISCDTSKEKNAIRDAYTILNEYVEKIVPDFEQQAQRLLALAEKEAAPTKKHKENEPEEIPQEKPEDQKKEEAKEEEAKPPGEGQPEEQKDQPAGKKAGKKKQPKPERPPKKEDKAFYNMKVKCKGLLFVKINPIMKSLIDPYVLCDAILQDVQVKKENITRYCHRITPVEIACQADKNVLEKHLNFLVDKYFPKEESETVTWMVNFKSRNNNKYSKQTCIEILQGRIPKHHKVDYTSPRFTINVEIIQNVTDLKKQYSLHPPGMKIPPPEKKDKSQQPKKDNWSKNKGGKHEKGQVIGTNEEKPPVQDANPMAEAEQPDKKPAEHVKHLPPEFEEAAPAEPKGEPEKKEADEADEDEVQLI